MYVVKALAAFAAVMVVAVRHRSAWHPFARFGAANWITTVRAALVSGVIAWIGEAPTSATAAWAVILATGATILDGLDGWAARRSAMVSAFGARFDMEVDALLILALAVLVGQHGKAGWWVVLSGLLRYLFIAAGWIWPWMAAPLPGTVRGKTVCIVQIVALLVALSPIVTSPASDLIAAAGLAALAGSFFVDIRELWRRAAQRQHN